MKNNFHSTKSTLVHASSGHAAIFNNKWLLVLLLSVFTAGCKKVVEEAGLTGICPIVISTGPASNATGVPINTTINATFNEAMDPATITTTTFILKQGTTNITGVVTYSGVTATFTPANNLAISTVYTATITTGAKDPAGNALVSDYVWSFTTGPSSDITPPIVIATDPLNGATAVVLNKKIAATFNEAMNPLTINSTTFILKQGTTAITGTVTYTGTTAVFSPSANLIANTIYTATITTGAKDLAGNALMSDYTWSFTTGTISDIIPPLVISTDPVNTATGVALNKKITATFSEAMNPLTINSLTFILKQGATAIAGTVTYSGTTAVFSPSVNLVANTIYTATITTGAQDLGGNALAVDYVWSFTTGAAPDIIPPTVISTDPLNAATGVVLNKKVAATFSEAMDPLTINVLNFTLKQGTTAIGGTVTYSGTTAVFSPLVNLASNTIYTATITTGAKDLAGNALATNYVWSFTTGAAPDIIPPTVISTDPVNGAIAVPADKKITATFSEAMNPLTINILSFTLKQGATSVLGTVTYSGITAMFSPSVNLASNTTYTATITTAVQDLAGNALATNYVWSFTTGTFILPPPLGSASIFGAMGGSAGITNQGLTTVINNGSISTTGASTLITGLHDGTTGDIYTETPLNVGLVTGRIYTAPPLPGTATSFAIATNALLDANIAYLNISPASRPGGTDPGAGELGGLTLAPGIYKSASGTFKITNGPLTLDALGDPNAVWIFQTAAGLTVGIAGPSGARSVTLINGAQSKNVFWYVGSAATINGAGGGVMVGTIIASAGVTFSTAGNVVQTVLNGRALSLNASVTLVNTTINVP